MLVLLLFGCSKVKLRSLAKSSAPSLSTIHSLEIQFSEAIWSKYAGNRRLVMKFWANELQMKNCDNIGSHLHVWNLFNISNSFRGVNFECKTKKKVFWLTRKSDSSQAHFVHFFLQPLILCVHCTEIMIGCWIRFWNLLHHKKFDFCLAFY